MNIKGWLRLNSYRCVCRYMGVCVYIYICNL